jgi:hypothetical protein
MRLRINSVFLALYRWYVPEGCLLFISAGLYLYNAFRYSYPVGYAGLYTLMSEQLGANRFQLPWTVPYYGPGGFPFAYPPVGFYLAALVTKVLNLSALTYLRFAPPLLTLLFLMLDYILIKKITTSRIKAILGVSLTATASAVYEYQVQAAGMVRSLALVFAVASLIFTWETMSSHYSRRSRYVRACLAGLALGLTIQTHLSYALFSIIGILVFTLYIRNNSWRKQIFLATIILGIGLVFSSLWWATIISRYGFNVLANPARSHGNFEVLHALEVVGIRSAPLLFIQKLIGITYKWSPIILVGLIVGGLVYQVLKRKWFLLTWFILIFLIIGEPDRYLLIIGSIVAADLIFSILELVHNQDAEEDHVNLLLYIAAICILLSVPFYSAVKVVWSDSPSLSDSVLEMSKWVKNYTSLDAHYLLLDSNNDLDEWIPYLTQRAPITGNWGAEWVGNLVSLNDLSDKLNSCVSQQSNECLQELISQKTLPVSCLISLNNNFLLNQQIGADPSWLLAYNNDQFVVFIRK